MNKNVKDILDLLMIIVLLYFFIHGALYVSNEYIVCDFVVYNYFWNVNQSVRLNLNQVKTFVNTSGLFNNNIILTDGEFIGNCSFVLHG